jgi:hypothetical protein
MSDETAPGWDRWDPSTVVELETAKDVTVDVIRAASECAEAAYGLGNDFRIDWERAYEMLEAQFGWYVVQMDSPADRKIRRLVNARRREEGLGTGATE